MPQTPDLVRIMDNARKEEEARVDRVAAIREMLALKEMPLDHAVELIEKYDTAVRLTSVYIVDHGAVELGTPQSAALIKVMWLWAKKEGKPLGV